MTAELKPPPEVAMALVRQGLDEALAQVSQRLVALADGKTPPNFCVPPHSALPRMAAIFGLDDAAIELLVAAAGYELDPTFAAQITALSKAGLTLHGAERLVGPAAWDHLAPQAPLRRWRMLELRGSGPLHMRELGLDERILHALLGVHHLDARLDGVLQVMPARDLPGAETNEVAAQIASAWRGAGDLPLVLIGGSNKAGKAQIAQRVAAQLDLGLLRLSARDIPMDACVRTGLATLIERELALADAVLLIDAASDTSAQAARLAETLRGPVMLAALDPPLTERAPRLRVDCDMPAEEGRRSNWAKALGPRADDLGEGLDRLAGQFSLDAASIASVVACVDPSTPAEALESALWDRARIEGRRAMEGLAENISSDMGWDDLVLPADAMAQLVQIEAHVRHGWRLRGAWGWREKGPRGLGCSALFAGPSGTGKTLAAEVLAAALNLDLFRIDLSQVVNKYIGETEKNLARIFDAAEASGAILLFDEADALFGRRTEVKDSHDRYANLEVSYLLQRMEAYGGLAILTTNFRDALDKAFVRRLRFIVSFPFPDHALRAQIWARVFPEQTPTQELDSQKLARLNLAGGSIRSVAINAASMAAAGPGPVTPEHIRQAAKREYSKMEKPFTAAEQGALK